MTEGGAPFAHTFATPFGSMLVVVSGEGGIRRLEFVRTEEAIEPRLAAVADPGAAAIHLNLAGSTAAAAAVERQVLEYCHGERRAFELTLDLRGTPFQRRVWAELTRIPYGETRSYGALAAAIERGGAARAVGRANATNPVCLVVPCHRLLGKDGGLTGFLGGIDRKRAFLDLESRHR